MGKRKVAESGGRRGNRSRSSKLAKVSPAGESGTSRSLDPAPVAKTWNPNRDVHPLLINHILEKVFSYVIRPDTALPDAISNAYVGGYQDLRNIRLVSKQWYDTATKLYRRGRKEISFGEPYSYKHNNYDSKMEYFLEAMRNSRLLPAQRFTLKPSFLRTENQVLMKDFMSVCGPNITELRIHYSHMSTMNFTRRSLPSLNLEKLKKLVFLCDSYKGKPFVSEFYQIPWLIGITLRAACNLIEFVIDVPTQDDWWLGQEIIKVPSRMGDTIYQNISPTVKILQLGMPVYGEHLKAIMEKNFKLQELQFNLHFVAETGVVKNLLVQQAPYLKVLKITDSHPTGSPPIDMPVLEQLRHLEMQGPYVNLLSYQDIFPKLESLSVSKWKTEKNVLEIFPTGRKICSMKEFYFSSHFPQAPLVKKVSQYFPNLRAIHISPFKDNMESLVEVFAHFPELEELYIVFPLSPRGTFNADSIFSGVSKEDCRRIKKEKNFADVDLEDVRNKPALLNLTKLRKLVLVDVAGDVALTDFTVHFVLLKMDSLKVLHCDIFQISLKYLRMMKDRFALTLAEDSSFLVADASSEDEVSSSDSVSYMGEFWIEEV